jgi:hypothetical protein
MLALRATGVACGLLNRSPMKIHERTPAIPDSLLLKLTQAVLQGAALASLSFAVSCAADADNAPRPTEQYSLASLGCSGEEKTGLYFGQCCVRASCYTPEADKPCASAEEAAGLGAELPNRPTGSGTCGCSPMEGPFAPNPDDADAPEGECCYTFGVIGCTGRPLTVEGAFVIAPLAARSDWAPFA